MNGSRKSFLNVDDINGNDEEINLVDFRATNVLDADGECELEPEMVYKKLVAKWKIRQESYFKM